jgi:hypothetical protein
VDDAAVRLRDECDRAIGASRSRIAALIEQCRLAEAKADERSAALRGSWQRRIQLLQNRTIAQDAGRMMDG